VSSAGLVRLIRRRRHRRGVATGRDGRPPLPPDQQPAETAIATASDMPLKRWAGHHLATLINDPPRHVEGGPLAVELSPETGIELLWDTPNPAAPLPWTATDGGWAWHLFYHPDGSIPSTIGHLPCPVSSGSGPAKAASSSSISKPSAPSASPATPTVSPTSHEPSRPSSASATNWPAPKSSSPASTWSVSTTSPASGLRPPRRHWASSEAPQAPSVTLSSNPARRRPSTTGPVQDGPASP